MTSAGRILIMPKGNYDSNVTYEMLDLIYYNGTSWLAKKTVIGIEPNEENSEYWHKLLVITDENFSNRNVLDYENTIDILYTQLPYTCPKAGEVIVKIKATNSETATLNVTKNSRPAAYINSNGQTYTASTFQVASNDVIGLDGTPQNLEEGIITFIPYQHQ